ncbi:hypothetical protein BH11ARM2_BH11ARM2_15800 [soil metagenome]
MSSSITVEVPIELREAVAAERGEGGLPRWGLETFVAEAVREGLISGGYAGQILGLSFEERERFLSERGVLHDESDEELREQQKAITEAMRQA